MRSGPTPPPARSTPAVPTGGSYRSSARNLAALELEQEFWNYLALGERNIYDNFIYFVN